MDNQSNTFQTSSNGSRALKITGLIILILIAIGAIAYSVYAYQHNYALGDEVEANNVTIQSLRDQVQTQQTTINELESGSGSSAGSVALNELGISIALPESLNGLTYSYLGGNSVGLSLVTLANQNVTCSAYSASPPLGVIEKVDGQYTTNSTGQLVSQFSDYYITYTSPQTPCSSTIDQQVLSTALADLEEALSTITEL